MYNNHEKRVLFCLFQIFPLKTFLTFVHFFKHTCKLFY
nr:MAG TPA: hypothetical protein [Caudoviricetes sp.]